MITHSRRRGSTYQRYSARAASRGLQRRLTDWATDPRTTTPQLHTALDEVLKNEPNPDWDIFAIKHAYLELMREIERPIPLSLLQQIEGEWTFGLGDMALSPTVIEYLEAGAASSCASPNAAGASCGCSLPSTWRPGNPRVATAETGRLGQVVLPGPNDSGDEGHNQGAAIPCQSGGTGRSQRAPTAGGGRLAGRNSQRQALACGGGAKRHMALATGSCWGPQVRCGPQGIPGTRHHSGHGALSPRARESPSSDEALVGTYLKSLPEDRSPDVDDGTAPIVE